MARRRKQKEPPPPGQFLRSKNGVPARLIKTRQYNQHDEWLYRLDYGFIKGTQLWTIEQLKAEGVRFLKRKPSDLRDAIIPKDDEPCVP